MGTVRQELLKLDQARKTLLLGQVKSRTPIKASQSSVANYIAALSPEFLIPEVMTEIRNQMFAEIQKQMGEDKRTRFLLEGIRGTRPQEKRLGTWKVIPKPSLGDGPDDPIQFVFHRVSDDQAALEIRLNHPLYVVFHFGNAAHHVPPFTGIHVFPTAAGIQAYPELAFSKYGIVRIDQYPWRSPDKKIKYFRVTKEAIPAPAHNGFPFIKLAWVEVLQKNPPRVFRTITRRMKGP